ncbi:MAG TPA: substrate-binding domain-containing protein, partial [Verrucomicrobiae bacterium]
NVITADGYRAMVMAIGKIHEYGYRRIGFTANAEHDQRLDGEMLSAYLYAQKRLALKPALPPLMTFLKLRTGEELSRQKNTLRDWLKQHRPDALITSDIEIPGMIRELGYDIPQDIAVAGAPVPDIPGVDAGLDHRAFSIGQTAAETLLKQMNINERGEPRHPSRILIESRWQDGSSLPPMGDTHISESVSGRKHHGSPPNPVKRRVTLAEIADKAEVSKNSVSLALRGSPRISPKVREKIRRVAGELGYVPDPILQRLAAYRHNGASNEFRNVIAWLNHWDHPEDLRHFHEFDEYWRGAKQAARRLGYELEEFIWPKVWPAKRAEQLLRERGVLGLLIPPHKMQVEWGDFDWSQYSLMRFGMSVRRVDSNLVTADHQRAMVMAVKRLHGYGYRRIGLIYEAEHDYVMGGNLYGGFIWAHKLLKLEPPVRVLDINLQTRDPKNEAKALKDWMQKNQPDAVIVARPQFSLFLQKLGYRIPEDVAVAVTSVDEASVDAGMDQCSHVIGRIAAEMLIKQISVNERGEPSDPCRILVESRWRDGKSLPLR